MITRGNYEEKIKEIGLENIDPVLQSTHTWYEEVKDLYDEDAEIKDTIDLYFQKLEKYLRKDQSKSTSVSTPESNNLEPKPSVKKVEKKHDSERSWTPVLKKRKIKPDKNLKVNKVEHLGEEIKIIRRYVGLHDKKKDSSVILNLIKALQKAVVEKRIGKTSKYASEIRSIQDKLVKIYNGMGKQALFVINDKDLIKLVSIAGGEKVFQSIGIIKRYIGIEGKNIEKEKAKKFLDQTEKLVTQGKLKEDPYENKVKVLIKKVKEYVSGKGEYVELSKAELNGLEGIVSGCSCSSLGTIYKTKGKALRRCNKKTYSDAKQGACSYNKGLQGIMTAEQIVSQKFEFLNFTGKWLELFGKPEKNFQMMVHGEPGAGKSTFILKFAHYLTRFGKVLYVSSEEFGSATLASKVKELVHPIPSNLHFASEISNVNISNYEVVVLDSINDLGLTLEDFKKLKEKNPGTAFILILQQTKQGQFKGGKEWEHEVQIAGVAENGVINIYKNRYGVKGSLNFFENLN